MGPGTNSESLLNTIVAGYQLIEVLGEGGWSWVYRGKRIQELSGAIETDHVAVKLLKPIGASAEERASNRKRFLAEAEAMRKLKHPNIVPILESGEDAASGFTYIVLPYINGRSLAQVLEHTGALPLDQVAGLLAQVAAALDYAHTAVPGERPAIIHRDVKPANILLNNANTPYLADFGIARILSSTLSQGTVTGIAMGTLAYMAPEQIIDASSVGPSAYIYSLGMTVYEMVTGHVAFAATDLPNLLHKQFFELPASPSNARPDLPEPAAATILKALAKKPEDRFQKASKFATAFATGLRGAKPAGVVSSPPPHARIRSGFVATIFVVAVLFALLTAILLGEGNNGFLKAFFPTPATATATSASIATNTTDGSSTTVTPGKSTVTPAQGQPTATSVPSKPSATATPNATATATQPPSPQIVTYYANGQVTQSNGFVQTTVSCRSGEVMVGGGANAAGTLFSDYPKGPDTWAAEGSGSYVGQLVDAYVVCIRYPGAMTTEVVASSAVPISSGGDARVSCPSGWIMVGGGYQVSPPPDPLFGAGGAFSVVVAGSTPKTGINGWDVFAYGLSGEQLQTFSVCTRNGFTGTTIRTTTASIAPDRANNITMSCSGTEFLTSGGGADVTVTSSQSMSLEGSFPTSNGIVWDYRPYNYEDSSQSHTGQVYIVCARF